MCVTTKVYYYMGVCILYYIFEIVRYISIFILYLLWIVPSCSCFKVLEATTSLQLSARNDGRQTIGFDELTTTLT